VKGERLKVEADGRRPTADCVLSPVFFRVRRPAYYRARFRLVGRGGNFGIPPQGSLWYPFRTMKKLTILPAMLLIASMSGQAQEGGPTVGDKAPEFQLPGSDGKDHSLIDYRGKPIIIAWFPKAFTGG